MAGEKHILVYVARHGTTDLNVANAFRGPVDVPLDKAGWRDANTLAYYFEGIDLCVIVHSDKSRTRETAKTIASKHPGIKLIENSGLNAFNVGILGGKPKNEENLAIVQRHVQNPDDPIPGGESLNQFRGRVRPLIQEAVNLGLQTGVAPLLVTHSSIIHEVGMIIGGHHEYTLVEPGGVAAIYIQNGKLDAEPIFKPRKDHPTAETIT